MFTLHHSKACRFFHGGVQQHNRVGSGLPQTLVALRASAQGSKRSDNPLGGGPDDGATDEELIRVLNTAHLWLPDEQSDEFGLDDVEAHLASRNQARLLDFNRRASKSSDQSLRSGDDVASLSAVDPESGDVPSWVRELTAEGFDVLGREGELFLQRGTMQQQQQPPQQQANNNSALAAASRNAALSSGAVATNFVSDAEPATVMTPAQRLAKQKLEEAAAAIPDSNLAVRQEFNPVVWQQRAQSQQQQQQWSAATIDQPAVAWYASDSSSSNPLSSLSPTVAPLHQAEQHSDQHPRLNVHRHLLGYKHPEKLLSYIESCFPAWSRNGCWLLHQSRLGVVAAPTPAEAAAALKGVALAAKRAGYSATQTQSLARDRRVLGLAECLRLTPPRTPSQQPASISRRLWSIAKDYWLNPGATALAAQQQLVTARRGAAAAAAQDSTVHRSTLDSSQPDVTADAAGGEGLGALLAQLQGSGLTPISRQQLAAAQSLIQARQADQLRQQSFVSAMWGLSVLGGPLFFQQEMEALCQVAAVGRWKWSSSELSDVLWSLANARHWSELLPQLDAALVAAGGVRGCTAPELITVLWSFATLAHRPQRLIEQLNSHGWAVKPLKELPATQRSKQSPAARRMNSKRRPTNQQGQQQRQQPQQPATADQGSLCQLSELSDSQLTSVLWSLSCLEAVNTDLFKRVWINTCQRGMRLAADVRQLVRLQQAALAVQLEAHFKPQDLYWDQGVADLLAAAAKAFKTQSSALQSKVHSSYQRSMASILAKQRVMHVLEDNTTGYSVDLSIPSLRVAIEADGPSHMSRNHLGKRGRVQLGATAMKRRHLQGLGWAVINVSYEDWNVLTGEQEKTDFLKQQIKAARAEMLAAKQP